MLSFCQETVDLMVAPRLANQFKGRGVISVRYEMRRRAISWNLISPAYIGTSSLTTMDLDDLWDVADTITGSVMKAAAKAAREMTTTRRKYYSSNLGVLAARLCDIHLSLKSLQPRQHSAISPQLEHFLTRLEEIFAVGRTIYASSMASADFDSVAIWCYHGQPKQHEQRSFRHPSLHTTFECT